MALPFAPPLQPMLALAQDEIPRGPGFRYEPKWDGFRVLVFKDGASVHLWSRNGQPLQRYFPEVVARLQVLLPDRAVVDGELVVPGPRGLDFDALQARVHPAASRVARLAAETPASLVAFDLLALGDVDLRERPFLERRAALLQVVPAERDCFPTPQTSDPDEAWSWFRLFEGAGLDGVIARREELPYLPGQRVMVKVKHGRTADCVVGGYRVGKTPGTVGSLLLGLYDPAGVLHHIGHTSSFTAKQKRELTALLAPHEGGVSFGEGRTPGAPSRWSAGKDLAWVALSPVLVCEVRFDQLQGPRLRHGASFARWRIDKAPRDCSLEQLAPPNAFSLEAIVTLAQTSARKERKA